MDDEILENLENEAESHASKAKKERKSKNKEILVACVKFRYIHSEKMHLKDIFGQCYDLEKGNVIIVPKGSLEQHCSTKKTLFERV